MRIAQISPYSMSVPGGVQGQAAGLAHAMRSKGHEVDLIAPSDGVTSSEFFVDLGHSVNMAANGSKAPVSLSLLLPFRLRRFLGSGGYDIIHIHEPLAPFVGVLSLLSQRGVVVGTFHRAGVSPTYSLYGRVIKRLARRLSFRYAVSAEAAATASQVLGGDYEVVGNGVELGRIRGAKPWPKRKFTVMFIGRHEHRKGLSVLLSALTLVKLDLDVWVAGDGPETLDLRAEVIDDQRVHWLGRVSDAEAAARLRAADVVCAPSLYGESFGVVLLEAMAAGAAVVATDIPGYRGVVRDGVEAILCRSGDDAGLAKAIMCLIEDPALLMRLQEAGKLRAEEFSMDRIADIYIDRYQRLLSENR